MFHSLINADTVTFAIRVYLWEIIKDEKDLVTRMVYSNDKQCKCPTVELATTKHYSDIKYYIAVRTDMKTYSEPFEEMY